MGVLAREVVTDEVTEVYSPPTGKEAAAVITMCNTGPDACYVYLYLPASSDALTPGVKDTIEHKLPLIGNGGTYEKTGLMLSDSDSVSVKSSHTGQVSIVISGVEE